MTESTLCDIKNEEGLKYLSSLDNNSIDLVLTDPPYIISKETGMNKHYDSVKEAESKGIEYVKTTEEWEIYKKANNIKTDEKIENYIKY